MPDYTKPSFLIPADGAAIHITIPQTTAQVNNPGITYNQAGVTYDDSRYTYGGLYKQSQDIFPSFYDMAFSITPHIKLNDTKTTFFNPGITYNQTGAIYNDTRYSYGGLSNQNQDVIPLIDMAYLTIPHIISTLDIYTNSTPPPQGGNQSLGPGWFMFVTH